MVLSVGVRFYLRLNISTIKVVKNSRATQSVAHRMAFLAVAGASLLVGLAAGASLLGFTWGPAGAAASIARDHGPLMVFGFVGGAIGLERTVAVRKSWAWAGPAFHVLGVVTLLAGLPRAVPAAAFAASFLVLGAMYTEIYRHRQPMLAVLVQAVGVLGGVAAAVQWSTTGGFAAAMPLAVLYAVATILGERMELARLTMSGARASGSLAALVLALAAAAVIFLANPAIGYRVMGLTLVACAARAAQLDVAKNLVRSTGLPRFTAFAMLAGYGWLALGGVFWLAFGPDVTAFAYDASIHAVFLGFVISMIFAHAPTILTSVIRRKLPYHPALYVPLILLHLGLALRIYADLRQYAGAYQSGGLATILAVLVFLITGIILTWKEARHGDRTRPQRTATTA